LADDRLIRVRSMGTAPMNRADSAEVTGLRKK
jgi:hypothetical protein